MSGGIATGRATLSFVYPSQNFQVGVLQTSYQQRLQHYARLADVPIGEIRRYRIGEQSSQAFPAFPIDTWRKLEHEYQSHGTE